MNIEGLIGVLDIGTNSVMLTIGESDLIAPKQISEFFRVTRLGDRVSESGVLNEAAVERTLDACYDFITEAKAIGVRRFVATATSAVRDASNGAKFIDLAELRLGVRPVILSGKEESEIVFLGTTADLDPNKLILTADPGGGSTEINVGYPGCEPLYGHSFDVGCVRFADRFNLYEIADSADIEAARTEIRSILSEVFSLGYNVENIVISGGTSTTFAAVCMAMNDYSKEKVHMFEATVSELEMWIDKLFAVSSSERAQIPGLENGRGPVLPTGLLIMSELLKGLGKEEFTVSTNALRYGMLIKTSREILEQQ